MQLIGDDDTTRAGHSVAGQWAGGKGKRVVKGLKCCVSDDLLTIGGRNRGAST